jgi:hypothetical protein
MTFESGEKQRDNEFKLLLAPSGMWMVLMHSPLSTSHIVMGSSCRDDTAMSFESLEKHSIASLLAFCLSLLIESPVRRHQIMTSPSLQMDAIVFEHSENATS